MKKNVAHINKKYKLDRIDTYFDKMEKRIEENPSLIEALQNTINTSNQKNYNIKNAPYGLDQVVNSKSEQSSIPKRASYNNLSLFKEVGNLLNGSAPDNKNDIESSRQSPRKK